MKGSWARDKNITLTVQYTITIYFGIFRVVKVIHVGGYMVGKFCEPLGLWIWGTTVNGVFAMLRLGSDSLASKSPLARNRFATVQPTFSEIEVPTTYTEIFTTRKCPC